MGCSILELNSEQMRVPLFPSLLPCIISEDRRDSSLATMKLLVVRVRFIRDVDSDSVPFLEAIH